MKYKLLALVAIILIGLGGYYGYSSGLLTFLLSPTQKLTRALEKTSAVDTLHAKFEMDGKTKITKKTTGISQSIDFIVNGYITGSTDGKVSQLEMAISSPNNPMAAVNMEVIATENEGFFVKGPATRGQWMHFTEEQFDEFSEGPTDGSLYPMNFIDSFFTTEKALTKSINPTSIETRKDDEVQGQLTNVYFVEISIPDYINFLSANEDYEEKDVADAEKILANAIVNAEIFVDKSTGYVIRLVINSENLTQIQTPESEPLGFDARHITTTTVDLSRFNLPTSIKEPENYIEYQDAVGSETEQKVLGVFN